MLLSGMKNMIGTKGVCKIFSVSKSIFEPQVVKYLRIMHIKLVLGLKLQHRFTVYTLSLLISSKNPVHY